LGATCTPPQVTLAFLSDAGRRAAEHPFNKGHAIVAMSIIDTAGAVVFFLVTLILILVSRRLCAEASITV
jgi:hypothetical protein